MIANVKRKYNQISRTKFGEHGYSKLWYVDNVNKVCITFSPRGGCSVAFKQYLDLVGLLEDGEAYRPFVHKRPFVHQYRLDIFNKHVRNIPIERLINQNYTFIKFIMNPYLRAVSIFWHAKRYNTTDNDVSFRQYLHMRLSPAQKLRSIAEKQHSRQQYITGEKKVITKYVKISDNESYSIILKNGEQYEFNTNQFSSGHHAKKYPCTEFCGDVPRSIICKQLPNNYKWFYDEEIRGMVERLYRQDINKYGFKFFDE